ncbi:dihydropteroate synthase [Modestobacter italicus]|uniref:dihydropteroate synthase n=1 Tax=Modestobacter italicus (strain DSM 44449 / CECT 9708 / BC 501) TaxID=2732864 RepID=UPI0022B23638|nr:dihydropteroate synthase [Modestobacter marinus]
MVNDVSPGSADARTAAAWSPTRERAQYRDVAGEVITGLEHRVADAASSGTDPAQLIPDPGLGFARQASHNWALLAGLDRLAPLRPPVLMGASRRTFLGQLLAATDGRVHPAEQRDAATLATTVLAAHTGAWGVRVHDVVPSIDAARTVAAMGDERSAVHGKAPTTAGQRALTRPQDRSVITTALSERLTSSSGHRRQASRDDVPT